MCLNLKLKNMIGYKSYLLAFKAFNNMLPLILNFLFFIKSGPYSMRCTNNCVGIICKSNIRSLSVSMIALNILNKLSNHVKPISSYTSYKIFTKTMLLYSYEWEQNVNVMNSINAMNQISIILYIQLYSCWPNWEADWPNS